MSKMKQPKISVIVPIYKVEKYLVQCIDSILNQTLKDIEVILVDEGDRDACRFIIDHYEQNDKRVKAIHEKNGGYGASVNKGMEIAVGEYISIIESDDFIEPTMYEEMYNYAKKLDADVVKTPYYEYRDAQNKQPAEKNICNYAHELAEKLPANTTFSVTEYPQLMGVHASLWSGIYKTSYMKAKKIEFIKAKGGAYVDVGFRIDTLINTDKTAWLNKPFYNYRLTNENSTTNQFNLTAMIQRWQEVHKKFSDHPDIYEKVGPESVYDEYLNTAGYLFTNYPMTQEQLDKIKELYQSIPDSVIKAAPKLTSHQKNVMLEVKHKNMTVKHYRSKNYNRKWYSSAVKISARQLNIHLLRFMKHNILRNIFRIGGIYVIDLCIGKVK
ncbi:MAG: glycosyltransferase family 2 protein [Alphaproteobacteria bacterium]